VNPRDWHEMREREIALLIRRTGEGLEYWNQRVLDSGIDTETELRTWLTEQGVDGYPRMLLVMERFGYPDYLLATADELVDGQYADRPQLRGICDRLLAIAAGVGEVNLQARKTYISLVGPRRTFALVAATTKKRVDLALRLDGERAHGRLLDARTMGNGSFSVRVPLTSLDEVDDEVVVLLQRTYNANT
jgi:hypothetical protein